MTGFWTPAREQQLADLVAGGKSAAQIAGVLGCSRNAVIGKVLRGKGRFGMLDGWASRRGRVEVRPRAAKPVVDAPSLVPADPLPPAPIPEPPAHPMPFSQAVDEERCLWFAGEAYGPNGPDMPVCGGERADIPGTRYCLHHLRRQAQDKAAA